MSTRESGLRNKGATLDHECDIYCHPRFLLSPVMVSIGLGTLFLLAAACSGLFHITPLIRIHTYPLASAQTPPAEELCLLAYPHPLSVDIRDSTVQLSRFHLPASLSTILYFRTFQDSCQTGVIQNYHVHAFGTFALTATKAFCFQGYDRL